METEMHTNEAAYQEAVYRLSLLVLGASESIEVLEPVGFSWMALPVKDWMYSSDSRLRLRCLTSSTDLSRLSEDDDESDAEESELLSGWELRKLGRFTPLSCLVVDGADAIVLDTTRANESGVEWTWLSGARETEPYLSHFNLVWEALASGHSLGGETKETLWDEFLSPAIPRTQSGIVKVSQSFWDDLITQLSRDPRLLHQLTPRRFEELIAEKLRREGLETHLTPERKDGGFDVLAVAQTPVGKHLYLVECKRYAPGRPVGVELVRALYGVVQQRNATAGLVVTTSGFTRGALEFQGSRKWQLDLQSYQDLVSWLNKHRIEK